MGSSVKVIIFKWITYAVGIFFLYTLFSMMYLQQYYTRHMPETKQIEIGRIVPIKVNYGKIVYITDLERNKINTRYYLFFAACILLVLTFCVRHLVAKRGTTVNN